MNRTTDRLINACLLMVFVLLVTTTVCLIMSIK